MALQPIEKKQTKKQKREYLVLLGLTREYIKNGKAIGSQTLKEAGFDDLSSATIRNYFASLEEDGFLVQSHASGGRMPTEKAYKAFAKHCLANMAPPSSSAQNTLKSLSLESREIASFLQHAAEILSTLAKAAVFLSVPKLDGDFIIDLKLVSIDQSRCLAVIVTDFGTVQTEILQANKKLSTLTLKKLESYLHCRLKKQPCLEALSTEEEALGAKLYSEVLMRAVAGFSTPANEAIYRTGFSKLLGYADFSDFAKLGETLGLLENAASCRKLLRESIAAKALKCWIGSDLGSFTGQPLNCCCLTIPYTINQKIAGAVGILAPVRVPYDDLFAILQAFSEVLSDSLTKSVYKFKIAFTPPFPENSQNNIKEISLQKRILLEDKSK